MPYAHMCTSPIPLHSNRALIKTKHELTLALVGADMHVDKDIAHSSEVIPDLEASRNGAKVLAVNAISRRSSTIVLGEEIYADDEIDRRIKWAQRGAAVFALLAISCYIPGTIVSSNFLYTLTIVFGIFDSDSITEESVQSR